MAEPYAMAVDLMDRVVAFFGEQDAALPSVRYVAPGDSGALAFDEDPSGGVREAVMVNVDYISPGQPGDDQQNAPRNLWQPQRFAQFAVTILRRAATQDDSGVAPTPAQIQVDGQTNLRDLDVLHRALEHIRNGSAGAGGWAPRGSTVTVGRTQTVGPQGAAVAVVGVLQAVVST
ncbi:hypothetical protein [Glutamicibacter sp. V16R2B1]|uniref:hypothetical protein n=1 Tax=Glutamicibacter sp. V16R2B1 TaxID=2036207 RepID=UPI0010FE9775|nr:hypothetical protein [Glutamicibacter sp. V16R2B1]MCK9901287.1 hypothetical protein [Frankia sp. Cpl3]TLK47463.1 hypothetical protein FDN03_15765 [Glutamicibacter sp. V16R2B1]